MSTIEIEDLDIVFGTGSHIDASVFDGEIFHPGYGIYQKDCKSSGGGVFLAIKNGLI